MVPNRRGQRRRHRTAARRRAGPPGRRRGVAFRNDPGVPNSTRGEPLPRRPSGPAVVRWVRPGGGHRRARRRAFRWAPARGCARSPATTVLADVGAPAGRRIPVSRPDETTAALTGTTSAGSSRSSAVSARRAPRSCSSATGSTMSSRCATGSPCSVRRAGRRPPDGGDRRGPGDPGHGRRALAEKVVRRPVPRGDVRLALSGVTAGRLVDPSTSRLRCGGDRRHRRPWSAAAAPRCWRRRSGCESVQRHGQRRRPELRPGLPRAAVVAGLGYVRRTPGRTGSR